MKLNKVILSIAITLFFTASSAKAIADLTIYAQSNGTYTYRDINYALYNFPVNTVLSDHSLDGNIPVVDSVAPIAVDIFPVDNVNIYDLRTLVRPLAVKFHRLGIKVNTRFLNKVIPYIFRK